MTVKVLCSQWEIQVFAYKAYSAHGCYVGHNNYWCTVVCNQFTDSIICGIIAIVKKLFSLHIALVVFICLDIVWHVVIFSVCLQQTD